MCSLMYFRRPQSWAPPARSAIPTRCCEGGDRLIREGEGGTPGRLSPSRPHAAEMQREHDGHRQYAEADRDPFEDDIRALGLEAPENREAGREIGEAPEDVD